MMIPMHKIPLLKILILLTFALSCSSMRPIKLVPGHGGEVVIKPYHSKKARKKAHKLMEEVCAPNNFVISKEEEFINTKENSVAGEWLIEFKCK